VTAPGVPPGSAARGRPGSIPRLHLITDDGVLSRRRFPEKALEVARALPPGDGFRAALHLRGPGISGRELWALGRALIDPLRERGVLLLVNDRADVASALGADGVHLAGRSLPAGVVRSWLGPSPLLGRSVHDPEATGALLETASLDYLLVGTLWSSASHPGRPGAGVRRLSRVQAVMEDAGASPLPLIGIGGVTPERVAEVLAHGGHGVAVLGAVWAADEPARAAERFRSVLAGTSSSPRAPVDAGRGFRDAAPEGGCFDGNGSEHTDGGWRNDEG
jgi:thiamine-phosphate diphosphorylase